MARRLALVRALATVTATAAMMMTVAGPTARADDDLAPTPTAPPPTAPPPSTIGPGRRALAIGLAVVPGVAARGLGSYVVHAHRAGRRLRFVSAIGLGAIILGGVPIAATYGSPRLIVPGVHLVVGGTGLVLGGWFADIWAAAGGGRLRGHPRALPGLAVELRSTWQHHAYIGHRLLLAPAAVVRRGRWAARLEALGAGDGSAFGGRLEVEARPWRHGSINAYHHTGSHLAVRAAVQRHDERDDDTGLTTGEVAVRGRLELGELDPHLAGTFLELEQGLGLELASYDAAGTDVNTVLLSRAAWGVYLPCGRGEVMGFYDHRRDNLAGGFPAGRGAGFFGSLGASAEIVVTPGWTGLAQLEVGASRLVTVGVRRELR